MDQINEVLTRGVAEILPSKDGLAKLMSERKITLYQGFDPSMPSLHLGNVVGLMKLAQFQKLGHRVIFLVGDFTGMIGDPTDKATTRKQLSREDVLKNAASWKEQAGRVLDFKGANAAEMLFNSQWLDKISFKDLIDITSKFTFQQMLERDMFQKRLQENKPIYLHEALYPVAQAIDSVEMGVDLEIGGTDQIFNMLAGRTLMKALKSKEKFVLANKLLVDKEGNKVGKTTGNALFLDSSPEDFYAGIMSFPDESISLGFELLTQVPLEGVAQKVKDAPMQEKKRLAFEVVKLLWGIEEATGAQKHFEKTFQERQPDYRISILSGNALSGTIAQLDSVGTISQAKRLISQGAVDVSGETVRDPAYRPRKGEEIKVGKKEFVKIK